MSIANRFSLENITLSEHDMQVIQLQKPPPVSPLPNGLKIVTGPHSVMQLLPGSAQ